MRIADWLARTAMLVLAALATLSLIGSLASVSNSSIGDAFPGDIAAAGPEVVPAGDGPVGENGSIATTVESPGAAPAPVPASTQAPVRTDVARWLKALTYAVIALAVFAAAAVVALARIAGQLRRIAGR